MIHCLGFSNPTYLGKQNKNQRRTDPQGPCSLMCTFFPIFSFFFSDIYFHVCVFSSLSWFFHSQASFWEEWSKSLEGTQFASFRLQRPCFLPPGSCAPWHTRLASTPWALKPTDMPNNLAKFEHTQRLFESATSLYSPPESLMSHSFLRSLPFSSILVSCPFFFKSFSSLCIVLRCRINSFP